MLLNLVGNAIKFTEAGSVTLTVTAPETRLRLLRLLGRHGWSVDAVESIEPAAVNHRVEVSGAANLKVKADRDRLEQVLINLLTNAIKYSPQADRVVVMLKRSPGQVEVAVQDFGIGISKEMQPHVFERYYRVESSAKNFSGLGIGLYISWEIIKRHKGILQVERKEGEGSIFTFTLPVT